MGRNLTAHAVWGDRSHGALMRTGTMGCSWEKGGPRLPSGLSKSETAFIVALVLVFYLQQRHLLYESMSVQNEKATSQEGHSCNSIHYHSAPGPVGQPSFQTAAFKVLVVCWGLGWFSEQCSALAP